MENEILKKAYWKNEFRSYAILEVGSFDSNHNSKKEDDFFICCIGQLSYEHDCKNLYLKANINII